MFPSTVLDESPEITSGGSPGINGLVTLAAPLVLSGQGAVVNASDPFTLFISGVDRTGYLKANTLNGTAPMGGRGTLTFTLLDKTASYRPVEGEDVQYFQAAVKRFGGQITNVNETFTQGTEVCMELPVQCSDYSIILDRKIVGMFYPKTFLFGFALHIMVSDLVDRFLAVEGISYDPTSTPSTIVGEQTFNYITMTNVLQQLCDFSGCAFWLDSGKVLRLGNPATMTAASPIALADNDNQWKNMMYNKSLQQYRNRQGVRPSQNLEVLWTDTIAGDGTETIFASTYVLTQQPVVLVNGVEQVVVELGQIGTSSYDFYYINQGQGVFQNPASSPLGSGDTLEILYPNPLPGVFWAQDDAEIAARQAIEGGSGIYEAVEDGKDVYDIDTALGIAAGLLAKFGGSTKGGTVDLPRPLPGSPLILPGQLLAINTSRPLVVGNFTVDQVQFREVDKTFLYYLLSFSDHSHQIRGANYFKQIAAKLGSPKDRIVATATWNLAETIEGFTNPGLSTGENKGVPYQVKKRGIFASATIYFKTAPVTNDVVVDLGIKNPLGGSPSSASIFKAGNANKLVFPVAGTAVITQYFFIDAPTTCNLGDLVQCNVLVADVAAMDGQVVLTMYA